MRRSLVGIALSLCLLAPVAGRAQNPMAPPPPPQMQMGPGGQPGKPGGELHAIFAQLGLTPDQRMQIKAMRQQKQGLDKLNHRGLREARRTLALALTSNSSEETIRSAYATLAQRREAIDGARFDELLDVRRILNPDQRRRFGELYVNFKHLAQNRGAEPD